MIIILFCAFATGFCAIYGIYAIIYKNRIIIEKRLEQLEDYTPSKNSIISEELRNSFADRVIRPALAWISSKTQKITPGKKREVLEKKLTLSGNIWSISADELISLNYALMVVIGFASFLIAFLLEAEITIQVLSMLWGALIGRLSLDLLLNMAIKKRQANISKALPDVLDLLTVSVEAGLGFDSAVQKVIQKVKGPIADEFANTLKEIKMGKPRKDALRDLSIRTGVEDLNNFITAIIQADQLGVSIGNVLRIQSKQMRLIRRQRIEAKAMKAPIKMLLPMVFFIFPTIFLVLLGPAAIQLMESLR